jgi:hypothetical protein
VPTILGKIRAPEITINMLPAIPTIVNGEATLTICAPHFSLLARQVNRGGFEIYEQTAYA